MTGSRLFTFLGNVFAQIFGHIVVLRVKELSNTNLFALIKAYVKGKVSLPVDVRRSETPLLKFPFLCCGEAGEKGKESALFFVSIAIFIGIPRGSLCGGERSQRENSLRGRRSKGKGKGIRTQANSKMIHVQQNTRPLPREQWFLQDHACNTRFHACDACGFRKFVPRVALKYRAPKVRKQRWSRFVVFSSSLLF